MYALQICRSAAHTVAERLAGCRAHNVAAVGCLQSTSAVALHTSKVGAMPGVVSGGMHCTCCTQCQCV
jgi:hypothetical protein